MDWFDNLSPFQKALQNSPGSVVDSPDFEEKLPFVETGGYLRDYTALTAMVEAGELVRPVEKAEPYRIRGFIDGVQRTLLIKYIDQLPLHFHMSAAVMMNEERDMVAGPIAEFCFLYPYPEALPRDFDNVKVSSTAKGGRKSSPRDMYSLFSRARYVARNIRRLLEREILQKALVGGRASSQEWKIILDGPIDREDPFITSNVLIGVVKRHFGHYLTREDERRVFGMPSSFRSKGFFITISKGRRRKRGRRVDFFYQRLREKKGDPLFGLVRVEHNRSLHPDRVAQTVNKYRLPVTDTPSWDRKLFSIFECELFLGAYLPSLEVLKGVFQIY